MNWGERFGVRSGEGRKVVLVFALFFCGGLARSFTTSGAYSLFLANFGGAMLPYVYLIAGVITALIMQGNLVLGDRVSFTKLAALNLGVCAAVSIALPLALTLGQPSWLVFAFAVWYECMSVMLPAVLWGTAGYLFTVRQGKRLFGLVSSGLPLGYIVSGLVTSWIVSVISAPNLLLLAAVSIGAALALALVTLREFPFNQATGAGSTSGQETANEPLWRNRYVLYILGLLAAWTLAFFIVDNIFYSQVGERFPSESTMAGFIGTYSTVRGFVMLVTSLLLTGPFLGRFGVRIGILALPLALAAGTVPLVLIGSVAGLVPLLFWPALATKLLNYAVDAIDRASINILYQPLPSALRARVPTLGEGVVQPIMTACAGFLLVVLTSGMGFNVIQLGYTLLIVLVAWIAIGVAIGRLYSFVLMKALVRRRLGDERLSFGDESSRVVLQQALNSPYADVVLYALNQLPHADWSVEQEAVGSLLEHPLPAVRCDVLARLEQKGNVAFLPIVRQRLTYETTPVVRGALLRTLAALDPAQAFDSITPALADPDPYVREGAAVGLIRNAGIGGVLAVGQEILRWAKSPLPDERASAARVLADVGDQHFYQPLVPLLADPSLHVQRAAIAAAGQLRSPRLWPLLIDCLDSRATGQASAAALLQGGDALLPLVNSALGQPNRTAAGLMRLAQVCGRIRTPAAAEVLAKHIQSRQPTVRRAVLRALSRCGYQAAGGSIELVQAQIRSEGEDAAWTLAALDELKDDSAARLLYDALAAEFAYQKANILDLLSFISPPDSVHRARDILHASRISTDHRAYALEVLDILTPQELKPVVLPLLEELSPLQRRQLLDTVYPQLAMKCEERVCNIIVDGQDRFSVWTQACAVDAVARLGLHSLYWVVADAAAHPEPIIRETAAHVLANVGTSAKLVKGMRSSSAEVGHDAQFQEERIMLSTIEKVLILKTVNIFASVPDDVLAAVAGAVAEVDVAANGTVFAKGDLGQAMYIIVAGSVRIHDGEQIINRLGTYDVFGEMALLDAEPRSASVTADEDTLLLRLQQDDFFDLFEDHSAIARGIIQVLSRRLRARSEEIAKLRSTLAK